MYCGVVDERAQQVLAWARQHFLKQDAVFFDVLVYEGNMAKKAKKAKKAKSAVKKTAKKTRRVKKKK